MRVTLLPRDDAARVITGAVSVVAWTAGAVVILSTIPALVETLTSLGRPEAIPASIGLLLLVLAGILVCMWRMSRRATFAYLAFTAVIAVAYQLVLIDAGILEFDGAVFLLNRPVLALVTIGVAARTALRGIAWCVAGYLVGWAVTFSVSAIAGVPVVPGTGPTIAVVLAVVFYLTMFAIQERQRRRFPRFDELEEATKRRAASADLASRTTAIVHDTVLNDLSFVMNAPDVLDERMRQRLLEDLDTLEGGEWMRATEQTPTSGGEQARVRNEFTRIANDFRWRGLTVNVTGAGTRVFQYGPGAGDALIGAVRATLENVLKHSGTDSAEVEIVYSDDELTFMVSDQGKGFDMAAVDPNRLGIRGSIVGRVEAVGGRVRIWSSPGAGTTVLISVPVTDTVDPGDPSTHQEHEYVD